MMPKDALRRGKLNVYQDRGALTLYLMNASKLTKKQAFSLIDELITADILKEVVNRKGKPLIVVNKRKLFG